MNIRDSIDRFVIIYIFMPINLFQFFWKKNPTQQRFLFVFLKYTVNFVEEMINISVWISPD